MYPGISEKINRELKLNRIVGEDSNIVVKNYHFLTSFDSIKIKEFEQYVIMRVQSYLEENIKPIKIYDYNDILDLKYKSPVTFVSDVIVTSEIECESEFEFKCFTPSNMLMDNNYLYDIGTFRNANICVNSFIKFGSNKVMIIKKPFYYYSNCVIDTEPNFGSLFYKYRVNYNLYFEKNLEDFVDIYQLEKIYGV